MLNIRESFTIEQSDLRGTIDFIGSRPVFAFDMFKTGSLIMDSERVRMLGKLLIETADHMDNLELMRKVEGVK